MSDSHEDMRAAAEERRKAVEPGRVEYARQQLRSRGVQITADTGTCIAFIFEGHTVRFYPYKGWATGKSITDGRGLTLLLKQLDEAMAQKHEGALLPMEEGNRLLANYERTAKPLPLDKLLAKLRAEYKMSHKVYGNKIAKENKGSSRYRRAVDEYCRRMAFLKQVGTALKAWYDQGEQGNIFNQ